MHISYQKWAAVGDGKSYNMSEKSDRYPEIRTET